MNRRAMLRAASAVIASTVLPLEPWRQLAPSVTTIRLDGALDVPQDGYIMILGPGHGSLYKVLESAPGTVRVVYQGELPA